MNIYIKSLFGALAFSLLFYSKSFGLNVLLIAILVVVLLSTLAKNRPLPWFYAAAYTFTAVMVFIAPTGYHLFVHLVSLVVFVGRMISKESSLYLAGFSGLMNMLVASVVNLSERKESTEKKQFKISKKGLTYLKGGILAALLLLIFGLLYRNANPVFEGLISQIDLSFISLPWVFFTLMGYLLFLHLLRPYYPKDLLAIDSRQSNELAVPQLPFVLKRLYQLDSEQTIGSIIFLVLNLLLLGFLITDLIYLLDPQISSNADYSASVHQGVYALMFSIVCAIALILYFFRGDLNFFKGNKRLRSLAFAWILLNTILVLFTSFKNWSYVESLGFTYKRIGVFVYLILVLAGLITAYLKITYKKSFTYMVRSNFAVGLGLLLMSSAVPWDKAITAYNLKHIENPDLEYLMELGNSNTPQLLEHARERKNQLSSTLRSRISNKYFDYSETQAAKTWQEYSLYNIHAKITD